MARWTRVRCGGCSCVPSGTHRSTLTVIRVQVERLPGKRRPPGPLWLVWIGGPLPDDLHLLWRWYLRRCVVEHAFRFVEQTLGWTTVRPRSPEAADRWTRFAGRRPLAVVVGSFGGSRRPPPLGTTDHPISDTRSGATCVRGSMAQSEHCGTGAPPARKIPGATTRPDSRSGSPLPFRAACLASRRLRSQNCPNLKV